MKHVPKHRAPKASPLEAPARSARRAVIFSGVAVAATGVAVSGGMIGADADQSVAQGSAVSAQAVAPMSTISLDQAKEKVLGTTTEAADLTRRTPVVSRSDQRDAADPLKQVALTDDVGQAMTASQNLSDSDPRDIARALLADYGFSADQFSCLDSLYVRESNWNPTADNPTSSAYGIPQALPGSKMASAGADWATNPVTQIRWGLGYIQDRYGSPCGAWGHSQSVGWY